MTDAFLGSAYVVALGDSGHQVMYRADGTVAPAKVDDIRYTTPEMLTVEQRVIDTATRRRHAGVGVAAPGHIDSAIAARPTMSGEQQAMVRAICGDGAGVAIVEGVAGAGKTFALAAAHQAWTASGYTVIGCALAARAAQELQAGSGIRSSTLDRLLGDLDRHPEALTDRHVIVIDEGAMVGTRKLLRLLEHAERAQAAVVLVGDPRQLAPIDAGGAFDGLARRTQPATLVENRRQHEPWERTALAQLRSGDTDTALDTYQAHGRVHHGDTADGAKDLLVDQWHQAHSAGEEPVMLAATRTQVADLNARARQRLQVTGEVGADQLARGDQRFAVGDQVVALRNDYRLGVLNGTRGTITDIDRDHRIVFVDVAGAEPLALPFDYLAAGHLTHGYALTVHKAQGMTTGRTLLLADDNLTRELAYVALSRGTVRNDIYLAVDDTRAAHRHQPEKVPDPHEAVRGAVRRTGAKTMALDENLPPGPPPPAGPSPSRVAADLRSQLTLDHLPRLRRSDRRKLKDRHTKALDRATTDIEDLTESITEKLPPATRREDHRPTDPEGRRPVARHQTRRRHSPTRRPRKPDPKPHATAEYQRRPRNRDIDGSIALGTSSRPRRSFDPPATLSHKHTYLSLSLCGWGAADSRILETVPDSDYPLTRPSASPR